MKPSAPLPSRSNSDEINHLVAGYRAGDSQAAQELLWRFDRYMQKWVRLLATGYWDPKDRELGHFLAMMGSVDVHTTAQVLHQRLRVYEKEDLQQEVAVCLLDTALRFGNISAQFRFRMKQRVLELLRDPLTYDFSRNLPLEESEEIPAPEEDLGPLWIEGLTCGKGFDELTCEDRLILLLAKHYGFPIERVAAILQVSPSTINRTIRRARTVLAVHYLDPIGTK
jgi:DNA-directed RNA polymerase specialized sigma24 family protein